MKGTVRLTTFSKVLILLLILGLLGGGIYTGVSKGLIKKKVNTETTTENIAKEVVEKTEVIADEDGNVINTEKTSLDTINLSLDEWIG